MLSNIIPIAFILITLALALSFFRLILGPDTADRLLALDTLYINSIALLLLYGIWQQTAFYFEAALLIAMLGFVSTIAVSKFLLRGDIIE